MARSDLTIEQVEKMNLKEAGNAARYLWEWQQELTKEAEERRKADDKQRFTVGLAQAAVEQQLGHMIQVRL